MKIRPFIVHTVVHRRGNHEIAVQKYLNYLTIYYNLNWQLKDIPNVGY
jgi:hypothetical protein